MNKELNEPMDRLQLYLPTRLKKKLEALAKKSKRSTNNNTVLILEKILSKKETF